MAGPNWNDLRFVLALARTETPAAAALQLGVDHTTVRRRLRALEDQLGVRLFEPGGRALVPTEHGRRVAARAESIEMIANGLDTDLAEQAGPISGSVRVGAPDGLGSLFLAPRLSAFALAHPALTIEFVAVSRVFNVSKREADIAVLMIPPKQGLEVIRKLTDCNLYLHATAGYLEQAPPLRSAADLRHHRFIGYCEDMLFGQDLNYLPPGAGDEVHRFLSTNMIAQYFAATAGGGICLLPRYMTRDGDGLVRVLEAEVVVRREIWITLHANLRDIPRYRAVADFIHQAVAAESHLFLA